MLETINFLLLKYKKNIFNVLREKFQVVFKYFIRISPQTFIDYEGSTVGLAVTQCIGLSGLIQWGMRQSAELENQMTAVERVLEFTRIEHEPDLESVITLKLVNIVNTLLYVSNRVLIRNHQFLGRGKERLSSLKLV